MSADASVPRRARRRLRIVRRARRSGFVRGASLMFDFSGSIRRRRISTSRCRSDAEALASDWRAVGDDLRRAMHQRPAA
ncbi:hypothetical protein [Candidatus Poriferisodalis sp.]|uniref:hypothetical protein n=1 Tax=Candidatus Poriferisodalis sp. TaxID=3101277 RepID=UPI003B018FBE